MKKTTTTKAPKEANPEAKPDAAVIELNPEAKPEAENGIFPAGYVNPVQAEKIAEAEAESKAEAEAKAKAEAKVNAEVEARAAKREAEAKRDCAGTIKAALGELYTADLAFSLIPEYAGKLVKRDGVNKAECYFESACALITEAHKAETAGNYVEAINLAGKAMTEANHSYECAIAIVDMSNGNAMLNHLIANAGNGNNFRMAKAAYFGDRTVYKRYTELYTEAMQAITAASAVKGGENNLSNADIEKALVFVNEAAETLCYIAGLIPIHFGVKHIRAFLMTAAAVKTDKAGSGKSEIIMKAENALRQHVEKDLHNVLVGAPRMECVKGNARTAANYAKQEAAKREAKAAAAVEAVKKEAKAENELKAQLIEAQKRNKRLFGAI